MLDIHRPPRSYSYARKHHQRTKWSMSMLKSVAAENHEIDNSSVEALAGALKRLTAGRKGISKELLLQATTQDSDLTSHHLADVLASIGMEKQTHVDCDVLARRLISRICNPPAILRPEQGSEEDD